MKADTMTTTTAPWEILTGPGWQGIGWIDAIADADGRIILYAADWGFDDERRAAARLAAAAPTMLAALQWAVEAADTEQYEACWYAAARTAITKATGA
jgi:hypothetical protein